MGDEIFFQAFTGRVTKGDRRKLEIIQAALRSISRRGIHGTTYDAIARELGIGRSQVAYHFPSFELIIETVMKYVTKTAQAITIERVGAASGPRERVAAYVHAAFEWAERFPDQANALVLFYHLCVHDPLYRALHAEMRRTGLERVTGMLAEANGLSPRSAQERGLLVQTLIFGALTTWLSIREPALTVTADSIVKLALER